MSAAGAEVRAEVLRLIGRGAAAPVPDEEFDGVAQAVFRHQFARNSIYRRYCEARGVTPSTVGGWREIPAVPTDAFKAAPLLCGEPADAQVAFRTSGTTRGSQIRGIHYLLDTRLYREALAAGFQRHLLPDGGRIRIVSLIAPAEAVPDSSLSFMISEVVRRFGAAESEFFASGSADLDGLTTGLRSASDAGEPILVAGTSLAFLHLLDHIAGGELIELPAGSRAMDTGGFKGVAREVGREELYGALGERLGIPERQIVNEYGMTEMSSQFYDGVAGSAASVGARSYTGPGWVRSFAADPETLAPLEDGRTGVLRHVDLANVDSVMALQTADLGAVVGGEVRLVGRARGAEARGCSIAMDELLEATRPTGR